MNSLTFLKEFYGAYPRIEGAFTEALDESLRPRGPDLLYDLVRELQLPAGASVLDLGCGEGRHAVRLAETFRIPVHGVDPVARQIELANEQLEAVAARDAALRKLVCFHLGAAESIPLQDASVDLIWCREVLYHVGAIHQALAECRRVLRPGGRILIYQHVATDRLEPREAAWQWAGLGTVPANTDPRHLEAAFRAAAFQIERCLDLGSEFGEYAEEQSRQVSRQLLHAARLLRAPERYIATFGQSNYDIMLSDCFWHIHRMIGKLSSRLYLLKQP